MPQIHTTLKPVTNIILIALWGTLAGAAAFLSAPHSLFVVLAGSAIGVAGGIMQWLAFVESGEKITHASSMAEIRKHLKTTRWGGRYVPLLWVGNLLLVVLAIVSGKGNPFLMVAAGYFSLMFARELITLKPTFEMAKSGGNRADE